MCGTVLVSLWYGFLCIFVRDLFPFDDDSQEDEGGFGNMDDMFRHFQGDMMQQMEEIHRQMEDMFKNFGITEFSALSKYQSKCPTKCLPHCDIMANILPKDIIINAFFTEFGPFLNIIHQCDNNNPFVL